MSRREMIEHAILGLSLPALGCFESDSQARLTVDATVVPPTQAQLDIVANLAKGRKKLDYARKCGQLWLDEQTETPGFTPLFNGLIATTTHATTQIVKQIKKRHLEDIKAQRFETVAGWTLSRTETHLYALLALDRADEPKVLMPATGQ